MAISHLLEALVDDLDTVVTTLNLPEGSNFSDVAQMVEDGEITGSSGVYKVATIQERDALHPNEGDMCVIYAPTTSGWQADTHASVITFPETVTLSSAYSEWFNNRLVDVNGTEDFQADIMLSEQEFRIESWQDLEMRISYYSEDGVVYTRNEFNCYNRETGDNYVNGDIITLPFEVMLDYPQDYDIALANFMRISSWYFGGLFTYNNNTWEYTDIATNITATDLLKTKTAYGNNGMVTGTFGTTINNNLLKTNYLDICECISNYQPTDLSSAFSRCGGRSLSISKLLDTSQVTNMSHMFYNSFNTTDVDCSNFDTSNVTNMNGMFMYTSIPALDLSSFNTSKVTDMACMFESNQQLLSLDLSNFNTSNVVDMHNMFYGLIRLASLDISNFNTSNVTNMNCMFSNCQALTSLDLSHFNTNKVTDMGLMFNTCPSLITLVVSNWNTSNVTSMDRVFAGCLALTSLDLSNWNTNKVTNMQYMFSNCKALTTLDIRNFDFTNVTTHTDIFGRTASEGVPNNCLIIVKDNTAKTWITSKWSRLTNVKTVAEYEASLNN